MADENPISLVLTNDGSHTLFHEALNETYHSSHGAITESRHVFIEQGLKRMVSEGVGTIRILEIGFGTGLNAILTAEFALQHPFISIEYVGLEPFPVPFHLVEQLNYFSYFREDLQAKFKEMHLVAWEQPFSVFPNCSIIKAQQSIEAFEAPENSFQLVYFDAFAPSKQAEMWQLENFKKMHAVLAPHGLLTTYCAKGQFKRDLKSAGFEVNNLPGPPGKREMTLGVKGRAVKF